MPYPDARPGCPILGCKHGRGSGMLMCKPCWSRVPGEIQKEVYAARKQRQEGTIEGGERYQMGLKRHEGAKKAAIEAVERRG